MLLDTSGLLCLLYASQPHHQQSIALFDHAGRRLVHNLVIAELVALGHARSLPRKAILRFAEQLELDPAIQMVWVGKDLHRQALALLNTRMDKDYSLCDAVSFVLMRQERMNRALTTDRHFEQEGFERLLY